MNVTGSSQSCKKIDAQALAIAVFKDDKADQGLLKELDAATGGLVSRVIDTEEFKAKEGETAYFHIADSELKAHRLLLIGCGERDANKTQQVSQLAGTASRFLRSKNAKSVAIIPRAETFSTSPSARGIMATDLAKMLSPLPLFRGLKVMLRKFPRV